MNVTPHCLPFAAILMFAAQLSAQQPAKSPPRAPPPPSVVSTIPSVPTQEDWQGGISSERYQSDSAQANPRFYAGSVTMSGEGGWYRVKMRVRSNRGAEVLEWGIARGRCGAKLMMLVPPRKLPQVDVYEGVDGASGNTGPPTDVIYEGPLALVVRESFHLVLFRGRVTAPNVVACANLKYTPP